LNEPLHGAAGDEVWITGVGLVSCLGEGAQAHWQGLCERRIAVDEQGFAPYVVHPVVPVDLDREIPRKGDQRQMEPWQRLGVYAAGLALADAGIKGEAALLAQADMLVAAGGGERDTALDGDILTALDRSGDPEAELNRRLMDGLRPTLFLAQLPNLLAGNISVVHQVTGSSRTFMGEEQAGVDALRVAAARIAAGQSAVALVGGAQNAERKDMLLTYALGDTNLRHRHASVWQRGPQGGFALGSMGAFLVLEARAHAQARGAKAHARLAAVLAGRAADQAGARTSVLERLWRTLAPRLQAGRCAILSGASGAEPATGEERAFLAAHAEVPVRATGTAVGHGIEPQPVMNVALASLAVCRRELFPGSDDETERAPAPPLRQVVVTSVGIVRGEGMALVEALE
jgi:3-oxoacyl-[acyl-carrier-protein] synthase II